MRNFLLILVLIGVIFTACNNTDTQTQASDADVSTTDAESEVTEPSKTPQESEAVPEPTDTSEPSPTDEPISSTQIEEIEQTYKALVMVQAVTEGFNETALRVESGELDGFESLGAIIAIGAMAKGIDEIMPEIDPPDYLASELRAARSLNSEIRALLGRWLDKEIDSSQVLTELTPLIAEIDTTVTDAEEKLAKEAGLDTAKLTQTRQEAMQAMAEVFEDPPTPEPEETLEPPEGDKFALNYLGEQESGGVTVEIGRVLVGDKEFVEYSFNNSFNDDIFSDKDVVGEVIFIVTNNSNQTVNLYPIQGSAQVNNEQIDFSDYMFTDVLLGEDMDGEIFPGVQKIGGLWFGIKRSSLDEIDSMTFRIDAPTSAENYQTLGEDYEIAVDLSNRIFEPLPEDLK